MDLFDLAETFGSMHSALSRVKCPIMVIGVKTDMLFPVWQQRELAQHLQEAGACQKSQVRDQEAGAWNKNTVGFDIL